MVLALKLICRKGRVQHLPYDHECVEPSGSTVPHDVSECVYRETAGLQSKYASYLLSAATALSAPPPFSLLVLSLSLAVGSRVPSSCVRKRGISTTCSFGWALPNTHTHEISAEERKEREHPLAGKNTSLLQFHQVLPSKVRSFSHSLANVAN